MPANIIVGIPNACKAGQNQRQRDFTPTHVDQTPNSGGANNFLSFFKNELIPYINKTYSTNPGYNTIWGSSLGGLLAMHAFLTQPDLFQSYVLSDPALWWDHGYLDKFALEKWDGVTCLNKSIYISGREGEAFNEMGILDGYYEHNDHPVPKSRATDSATL